MISQAEVKRDVVLVGGGHSHALALRMLAMQPVQAARITLISPSSYTPYSGMLPGLIAGHYTFEESHINLAHLCAWAGARFIRAAVNKLDAQEQRISLSGRPDIHYDIVSLDIGSEPELASVPGAAQHAIPVKPVAGLWQRWQTLERRVRAGYEQKAQQITVVGGGAGSVELALAMALRLGSAAQISLLCGSNVVLPGYNTQVRRVAEQAIAEANIDLHRSARVVQVNANELSLANGQRHPHDELFWCTGAAAAPWIKDSGLPVDAAGFLQVTPTLQSPADDTVFAAGDIAAMLETPRPKAGVYAVRQAPVLAHNLRAVLNASELRRYRPQKHFLSLLSLGEKRAVAQRGRFSSSGAWVWQWKDRIDRKFMRMFTQLPAHMAPLRPSSEVAQLPCGGCGAKIGSSALSSTLQTLAQQFPKHCMSATEDASPLSVASDATVLQSIDLLRQIDSDPWLMGRIAVNHALSDLYACGAQPLSALAAVTLPFATERILERDLEQLLSGALHELSAVDCVLSGGHSMQGPELQLGFVVNGQLPAGTAALGKRCALSGDSLLLTKPLGAGVLFAAQMQRSGDSRHVEHALEVMLQSNAQAAQLARDHHASACTDVTGFGLLGHLLEMLEGTQAAQLQLKNLPLMGGALTLVEEGLSSTMAPANVASFGGKLDNRGGGARAQLLFDPQTSGGLLIAVSAAEAPTLQRALVAAGYAQSAIIGSVTTREVQAGTQVTCF